MHLQGSFRLISLVALAALSSPISLDAQDQAAPPAPSTPSPDATPNPFFFHDGDTPAVFLGDTITEQKLYTTLVETYVLTRFPTWKISFRNVGWDGDTSGLLKRGGIDAGLSRDVLPLNPKAVVIAFGMNDARGGQATYSYYLKNTTKLVKDLEKAGARVALVTSSPEEKYEPGSPAGSRYNVTLKKYVDGLKVVSDNEKVPFVDQYSPFVALIEAGRAAGVLSPDGVPTGDADVTRLTSDGIHPNWGGHFLMATLILQALKAPAMVSSVSVDAAAHSITASEGCSQVEWQDAPPGCVQIKRIDNAEIWPLPGLSPEAQAQIDLALKIPGFDPYATLNRYELKVTNLKDPLYSLTIDGQESGVYPAADLANGVNLALQRQGPLYDQGQDILKTVIAKNDAYFERWRNLQLFQMPDWLARVGGVEDARAAEIARLDKLISDDEQALDLMRKPSPHILKLTPVTK